MENKMNKIGSLKQYILKQELIIANENIKVHRDFLKKYREERNKIQERMKAEYKKTEETINRMNEIGLTN